MPKTATIKCPSCGAPARIEGESAPTITCEYCGNTILVPEEMRSKTPSQRVPLGPSDIQEILDLTEQGNVIEAIKRVREKTGMGLAEAKVFVDRLRDGQTAPRPMERESGRVVVTTSTVKMPGAGVSPKAQRAGCVSVGGLMFVCLGIVASLVAGVFALGGADNPIAQLFTSKSGPLATIVPAAIVSPFARVNLYDGRLLPGATDVADRPTLVLRALFIDSPEAERWKIISVDTSTSAIRWRSATSTSARFVAGSDVVVTADKSRLVGLDANTGATKWETTLPDQISGGCESCLSIVGQRVVALSADSTVTALDVKSGGRVWSRRVSGINKLWTVGDQVLLLERQDKDPFATLATLIDADGREVRSFPLTCTPAGQTRPQVGYPYDSYAVDSSGKGLYAWYGSPNSCLQKYDLGTGKLAWSGATRARATSHDSAAMIVVGDRVFAGGDRAIVMGDVSGKVAEILTEEDYTIRPLDFRDGVLVVRAYRTRGTSRFELWGIDIASGRKLWQHVFDMKGGPLTPPQRASGLLSKDDDDELWTAALTPGGVAVIRITRKPEFSALVDVLNLKDGVSAGRKTIPLKNASLLLSTPTEMGWQGATEWMLIDNKPYAFNTATGTLAYQLP